MMTSVNELTLASAVLIGLFGSSHCLGMCGGLSSLLGVTAERSNRSRLFSYNLGRLTSYTVIGALAGLFGEQLLSLSPQLGFFLRVTAGLLLVAMGLYVSQWWTGLTYLERVGAHLWRHIQPLVGRLLPIKSHWQALLLGSLWGFLPCGLVYSTLSWAVASAQWQQSALLMLAFGIGTLPAMLSMGFAGEKILQRLRSKNFRLLAGLMIIAMGLVTIFIPWSHSQMQSTSNEHHQMHH